MQQHAVSKTECIECILQEKTPFFLQNRLRDLQSETLNTDRLRDPPCCTHNRFCSEAPKESYFQEPFRHTEIVPKLVHGGRSRLPVLSDSPGISP